MTKLVPEVFVSPDNSYESARDHAEKLDLTLGFEILNIENNLLQKAKEHNPEGNHKTWGQGIHQGNQTWVGLSHQTLQTPYNELRLICDLLNPQPNSIVVDLGAGYGRLGITLAGLYPEVNFIGYEYVPERVEEGNRIFKKYHCSKATLHAQDLTEESFKLPEADFYFLYDYGTLSHIRKTLNQLESMADRKKFKLVARGKGTIGLVQYEYPWLSQINPSINGEQFAIYSI